MPEPTTADLLPAIFGARQGDNVHGCLFYLFICRQGALARLTVIDDRPGIGLAEPDTGLFEGFPRRFPRLVNAGSGKLLHLHDKSADIVFRRDRTFRPGGWD